MHEEWTKLCTASNYYRRPEGISLQVERMKSPGCKGIGDCTPAAMLDVIARFAAHFRQADDKILRW